MRRVVLASLLAAGCADPVEYQVTMSLQQGSTARLVVDGLLYVEHTELYEVNDYDELRDTAASVVVRSNNIDYFVVLPFAASACGSDEWIHSGELARIEVDYSIYGSGTYFNAYTDVVTCIDSNDQYYTVNR